MWDQSLIFNTRELNKTCPTWWQGIIQFGSHLFLRCLIKIWMNDLDLPLNYWLYIFVAHLEYKTLWKLPQVFVVRYCLTSNSRNSVNIYVSWLLGKCKWLQRDVCYIVLKTERKVQTVRVLFGNKGVYCTACLYLYKLLSISVFN